MLKKAAISILFFLLLAAASLWYYCFHILPKDLQEYEKDLKSNQSNYHLQKNLPPCLEQSRTGIKKDMWILAKDSIEHHLIEAADGKLTLQKLNNIWNIQEHLQDVVCLIDAPNQQLKIIKTKEGFYNYKTKIFCSPHVDLFFFNSSSNSYKTLKSLPVSTIQAKAYDVSFSLNAPELTFQAKRLFGSTKSSL